MAITRRQFVTTLGALAAAMGVGQSDISKITEAFAHGSVWGGAGTTWLTKPKVVWVHGAECTGCSTSLLSFFEDVRGESVEGSGINTLKALDLAVGGSGNYDAVLMGSSYSTDPSTGNVVSGVPTGHTAESGHPFGHRTLHNTAALTDCDFDSVKNAGTPFSANIADVLIDFIDLQYHETVMGMGGDLAYQWLADNMYNGSHDAFVLVVEGAVQPKDGGGFWGKSTGAAWCSIGMDGTPGHNFVKDDGTTTIANAGEHSFDDVVRLLAHQAAAVIAVGQCACWGGYPACNSPELAKTATGHDANQTGAMGVHAFLTQHGAAATDADKVINVPGCPINPWWFVLTVVAWLVDFVNPDTLHILDDAHAIKPGAVDGQFRLKAVYGTAIHGKSCPRYQDNLNGKFCSYPGEYVAGSTAGGCLQMIGCKGPSTNATCNVHGWNSMQPNNDSSWESNLVKDISGTVSGASCIKAGAPCMGCTEKGYPDAFLPFVVR